MYRIMKSHVLPWPAVLIWNKDSKRAKLFPGISIFKFSITNLFSISYVWKRKVLTGKIILLQLYVGHRSNSPWTNLSLASFICCTIFSIISIYSVSRAQQPPNTDFYETWIQWNEQLETEQSKVPPGSLPNSN